ncbi:hypothetical protein ANO11243_088260 [Dothideomycetidae sp. 11243]|nr:hypothetical protein ANO11243_088260 [fungal sp. No.11243]
MPGLNVDSSAVLSVRLNNERTVDSRWTKERDVPCQSEVMMLDRKTINTMTDLENHAVGVSISRILSKSECWNRRRRLKVCYALREHKSRQQHQRRVSLRLSDAIAHE